MSLRVESEEGQQVERGSLLAKVAGASVDLPALSPCSRWASGDSAEVVLELLALCSRPTAIGEHWRQRLL